MKIAEEMGGEKEVRKYKEMWKEKKTRGGNDRKEEEEEEEEK